MNRVTGIGVGGVIPAKSRPAAAGAASGGAASGNFNISSDDQTMPAREAQPIPGVMLSSMLALQEVETDTMRDKAARRHGFALLQALLELQQGLLSGHGESEIAITALSSITTGMPEAADPALAEILDAVRPRAKIELLRRGVEIS